jgi:hypothetical protein
MKPRLGWLFIDLVTEHRHLNFVGVCCVLSIIVNIKNKQSFKETLKVWLKMYTPDKFNYKYLSFSRIPVDLIQTYQENNFLGL